MTSKKVSAPAAKSSTASRRPERSALEPAPARPPRPSDHSAVDSTSSRIRILEAALELMAEKGYSGTSISMICARSGLPPSSTYWHFGSKEGVLAATVEYGAEQWIRSMPRWEDLPGSPVERLRQLLSSSAASLASRPAFLRMLILLPLEQPSMSDKSLEVIRLVRHRAAAAFRRAFREIFSGSDLPGVDQFCDDLGRFALAVSDGAFIALAIERESANIGRIFDQLASSFLALGNAFVASGGATSFSSYPN